MGVIFKKDDYIDEKIMKDVDSLISNVSPKPYIL